MVNISRMINLISRMMTIILMMVMTMIWVKERIKDGAQAAATRNLLRALRNFYAWLNIHISVLTV